MSPLCWSLGRVKLKCIWEAGHSLCSPFPSKGNFLAGEFPLGSEQRQAGGWADARKMKLFFLSFLCSYSQVFVVAVFHSAAKVS